MKGIKRLKLHKKKNNYEEHEDLVKFEEKYNNRIDKFLKTNPETRVVFLNADFGWGKTSFIKNNLKVKDNLIYSPWLNKSENYIEEIYYNVTKKDKSLLSSMAIFVTVILTLITILSESIIDILMELLKGNTQEKIINNINVISTDNGNLQNLLLLILGIFVVVCIVLFVVIFFKPVPLLNYFKKDNGKYYENKIIKKIVEKIDKALVIEDIDRTDDIEDILITANKISEYIKENNLDKYVLITGDYIRMIKRITTLTDYSNRQLNLDSVGDRGMFTVEKIVSLRVDFVSISERIDNLLKEEKIDINLTKIERDEIIQFVKQKYLSIRFFVRFLQKKKVQIERENSVYYVFLQYFQEEKFFFVDESIIKRSIYNVDRFPTCMNDIEMLLQKKIIKINDIEYTDIQIKDEEDNYDIIKNAFNKLFLKKEIDKVNLFKKFYDNGRIPIPNSDVNEYNKTKGSINLAERLKPHMLKKDLDNFLIGHNNNESMMHEGMLTNKRCYFPTKSTANNYEDYKITQLIKETINPAVDDDIVEDSMFIYAYIGAFFRKNIDIIRNDYIEIYQIVNEIAKEENEK